MSITFCVSRLANKFNFFSIQTGWHFSVKHRKEGLTELLVKHGELSSEEDVSLQKLAHFLQRHSFGRGFIGEPFLGAKESFSYSDFENVLSEREYKDLEKSFEILDRRWKLIWKEEKPKLVKWGEVLEKALENVKVKKIFTILKQLYSAELSDQYLVQLLISAPNSGGGGAWSGVEDLVTLECSGLAINKENKQTLLGTLFHEITHLVSSDFGNSVLPSYLRVNSFFGFGKQIQEIPTVVFFTEGVVHPFFPRGVLGRNYLGTDNVDLYREIFEDGKDYPLLASWGVYAAENLQDTAELYVEENRALDEEFLDEVCVCLERFLNNYYAKHSEKR